MSRSKCGPPIWLAGIAHTQWQKYSKHKLRPNQPDLVKISLQRLVVSSTLPGMRAIDLRKGLEDCIGYSVTHPTWQRSRPERPGFGFPNQGSTFSECLIENASKARGPFLKSFFGCSRVEPSRATDTGHVSDGF